MLDTLKKERERARGGRWGGEGEGEGEGELGGKGVVKEIKEVGVRKTEKEKESERKTIVNRVLG